APVSPRLTFHELGAIVADLEPAGVITESDSVEGWKRLLAEQKSTAQFVVCPETLPHSKSALQPPSGNPIISCHYTYKGLGYPLGALHRYEDYSWSNQAMAHAFPEARHATHLVGLPVYPIYGLTAGVLGPLSTAGRLLLTQRIFEIDVVELLERYQPDF